jgi:hypothetical protein
MAEQGSKAGRQARHQAAERARKELKRLRERRARIHRAMGEAESIRKRRKRGQGNFDKIMSELGYGARSDSRMSGREITGTDVLDKYEEMS